MRTRFSCRVLHPGGLVCAALLTLVVAAAHAQRPADPAASTMAAEKTAALRIFLDCDAKSVPGCDSDFLRTEIAWIRYTRDRKDAQVHVLATSLATGSGGTEVLLRYVGLAEFAGLDDDVRIRNPLGATDDDDDARRAACARANARTRACATRRALGVQQRGEPSYEQQRPLMQTDVIPSARRDAVSSRASRLPRRSR